ncbi:hypothetical protein LAZ67_12001788 [Cordylochernes scorpioides]|uniref:Uncharacterized protein n=1 Tax=Cordylochernes scorpioides TaxID=51811 RepID=A0ABY6L3R1_9ARAC|nr:hypothetical protein LAZ67_12001788 [Cordylochernes scorpioides]
MRNDWITYVPFYGYSTGHILQSQQFIDSREIHLTGVKRIYRYLKGTRNKMLVLEKKEFEAANESTEFLPKKSTFNCEQDICSIRSCLSCDFNSQADITGDLNTEVNWFSKLKHLPNIEIPRWLCFKDSYVEKTTLHSFCDAS